MTTITQTIPTMPTAPARTQAPATYISAADAWNAAFGGQSSALNTWAGQCNTVAGEVNTNAGIATSAAAAALASQNAAAASALTAINAPGTSATSTTSDTIALGSTTITVQTGKALVVGMWIVAADTSNPATNWMAGQITAYNSGTGSLTYAASDISGSGTLSAWTVSLTAPITASGGWLVKTANYTAVSGDKVAANTSGGAWTLTLPATPSAGNTVQIADAAASFATHALTIDPNGGTIAGASGTQTISTNNLGITFVYSGTTWGFA